MCYRNQHDPYWTSMIIQYFFYFVQLIAQNTIKHVKEKLVNSTF